MRWRIVELVEQIRLWLSATRFPTEYRDEILRSRPADVVSRATMRSAGIIFIEMGICPIISTEPVIWHSVPPLMAYGAAQYPHRFHSYRISEHTRTGMYCIPISADMRNDGASPCHIHSYTGTSNRIRKAASVQWIAIEMGRLPASLKAWREADPY